MSYEEANRLLCEVRMQWPGLYSGTISKDAESWCVHIGRSQAACWFTTLTDVRAYLAQQRAANGDTLPPALLYTAADATQEAATHRRIVRAMAPRLKKGPEETT
jgi:hypothetical protein